LADKPHRSKTKPPYQPAGQQQHAPLFFAAKPAFAMAAARQPP
jgi:hypothetical protein